MRKLKIGVIGTGNMGRNHVRILSEEKDAFELIGIYEPQVVRAQKISEQFSVKAFTELDDLLHQVSAVVIAVPSSLHKEIALKAAEFQLHTLVEKPLAINSSDALEITRAFVAQQRVLAVGHVERYNPVITELAKLLKHEEIIAVEARRYSPFDGRISDANVVEDLMIHDIDLVCNVLLTAPVKSVNSTGTIRKSKMLDLVQSIIQFEDGTIANISASRITENKIREITVHTERSYIVADLLAKSLFITKNVNMIIDDGKESAYKQDSVIQKIFVPMVEPLKMELMDFYRCITNQKNTVMDGKTASRVISICENIVQKATDSLA